MKGCVGYDHIPCSLFLHSYRAYCVMGDGESAEGSVWEAASFASKYKLDNLVGIIDVNRLGQSEPTALAHDVETYRKRMDAFGWNAIIVDGHSVEDLCKAFCDAENCKGKPTCLIAKTLKGEEGEEGWAGRRERQSERRREREDWGENREQCGEGWMW